MAQDAMAQSVRPALPRRLAHLQRDRLGTFYFRLTVAGKTRRKSLRTKDPALATMRAAQINYEWSMAKRSSEPSVKDVIESFKRGDTREFDVVLPNGMRIEKIETDEDVVRAKRFIEDFVDIGPIAPEHRPLRPEYAHLAPKRKRSGRSFLEATKPHLAEWGKGRDEHDKGLPDKKSVFAAFAKHAKDPDLSEVDKAMAVSFKQALLATDTGTTRINAKIGHLKTFFEWSVANGEANSNPFDGIRIPKSGKAAQAVESYEPFTAEELAAIFDPSTYPAYAVQPHYYWLPFLLLYTGARPDELASLRLSQIRREQGIDYIALKAGKNTNSIRKIPLHRVVAESAFPAYVEERRRAEKDGKLFPLLRDGKNGHAKNVSRRFNETYLRTLKIDDPTHRLYSFRATFITRMSELNANTAMLMALVGHFEQEAVDLSSPHFKNYQGAKLIGALKETIDMLDFTLPISF